jgi:hypothetical protein
MTIGSGLTITAADIMSVQAAASAAQAAITALGSMSAQSASAVAITGGSIGGTTVLNTFLSASSTSTSERYVHFIDVENTSSSGNNLNSAIKVVHDFGGGSGGYQTLYLINNMIAPTTNAPGTGNYVVATFVAQANCSDGGTSLTPSGNKFGTNVNVRFLAGALHWDQLVGHETDIGAYAGSSVAEIIGHQIICDGGASAYTASRFSAAYLVAAPYGNDGSGLFQYGLCFGAWQGQTGIQAGGTLIGGIGHVGAGSAGTVAWGTDFSNFTFTSGAFRSTGYLVDGSGNTTAASIISNTVKAQTTNGVLTLEGNGNGSVTVGSTTRGTDWSFGGGGSTPVVNHGNDYGSPSGGGFVLHGVTGTDTNIGHIFQAKGVGTAYCLQDGNATALINVVAVASGVNGINVVQATTGNAPSITPTGTDTNINLDLEGKGTGIVTAAGHAVLTSGVATAGGAFAAVSLGSSPATYTFPARGTLFVNGGTVTSITLHRGSTIITTGQTQGGIAGNVSDTSTITYSTIPTSVNFVPA